MKVLFMDKFEEGEEGRHGSHREEKRASRGKKKSNFQGRRLDSVW